MATYHVEVTRYYFIKRDYSIEADDYAEAIAEAEALDQENPFNWSELELEDVDSWCYEEDEYEDTIAYVGSSG